jgi:hypothetical protein
MVLFRFWSEWKDYLTSEGRSNTTTAYELHYESDIYPEYIQQAWPGLSILLGDQIMVAWPNAAIRGIRGWDSTFHSHSLVNSLMLLIVYSAAIYVEFVLLDCDSCISAAYFLRNT